MDLYTKEGRPLQVSGVYVYSKSGTPIGRLRSDGRVTGTDGRYVGTVSGDRLVYRSSDSGVTGASFSVSPRAGSARANRSGSTIAGEEPDIPD